MVAKMTLGRVSGTAWALIATAAYAIGYAWIYQMRPGGGVLVWLITVGPIVASLLATGGAILAWRNALPAEAFTWGGFSLGMGLWAAAELTWGIWTWATQASPPTPSLADGLWLLGYLPSALAILYCLVHLRPRITWNRVIFAVLCGAVVPGVIMFAVLRISTLDAELDLGLLVNALYPALDILMATGGLLVFLVVFDRNARWNPWIFIGIAWTLWAYADAWFALLSFMSGNSLIASTRIDIPYTVAYILIGIGCFQSAAASRLILGSLHNY